jgi:5'(3')-deoxyribonucleotidase
MDDVIADFGTAVFQLFPEIPPMFITSECMTKNMGITIDDFWGRINASPDFWETIPAYPHAQEMYRQLGEIAPVTILSSPSRSPAACSGKLTWLHRHLGEDVDFMFGASKWLLAKPQHLLIDDRESNTVKFIEHGGHAIAHPQLWNSNAAASEYACTFSVEAAQKLVRRLTEMAY